MLLDNFQVDILFFYCVVITQDPIFLEVLKDFKLLTTPPLFGIEQTKCKGFVEYIFELAYLPKIL